MSHIIESLPCFSFNIKPIQSNLMQPLFCYIFAVQSILTYPPLLPSYLTLSSLLLYYLFSLLSLVITPSSPSSPGGRSKSTEAIREAEAMLFGGAGSSCDSIASISSSDSLGKGGGTTYNDFDSLSSRYTSEN